LLAWLDVNSAGPARAACLVESADVQSGPLKKHVSGDCTDAEREVHAVEGRAIIKAIIKRRPIDLAGVVIRGELLFDRLPVQVVRTPKALPPDQREALREMNAGEVRTVTAPVRIRDSILRGAMRHASRKGTLQFEGPVDFHGTRFTNGVDLSRSVFLHAMDLSAATFEREAYWIQGQFGAGLNCAATRFGPHTRFHRSVFRGPVDCTGALFDGIVEFLEAEFEEDATFAGARFGLGTGFSGSRFARRVSFADAIFSREAFFTFTRFEAESKFSGAQFLSAADFSNAEFKRIDDLAHARFDRPALFKNARRVAADNDSVPAQSSGVQYAVTLVFLLMAALLVAYAIKLK
jgi:uncharacterized protein YjbI with pentapeptide repeats